MNDGLVSSPTPHKDAVRAWLDAGDWSAPLILPGRPRYENPPEWDDPARRLAACIALAASGAPASLPRRSVVINGKRIPEPPRRRRKAHVR